MNANDEQFEVRIVFSSGLLHVDAVISDMPKHIGRPSGFYGISWIIGPIGDRHSRYQWFDPSPW